MIPDSIKIYGQIATRLNELGLPMNDNVLNLCIGRMLNEGGRMLIFRDGKKAMAAFRFNNQIAWIKSFTPE